jgi:hypothetical protein
VADFGKGPHAGIESAAAGLTHCVSIWENGIGNSVREVIASAERITGTICGQKHAADELHWKRSLSIRMRSSPRRSTKGALTTGALKRRVGT